MIPEEGKQSPWGTIQYVYHVGHGIYFVSTAGHGGMYIPPRYNKLIPEYFRNAGGWYEEDCDFAIPCFILGAAYFFHAPHTVRFILSGEAEKSVMEWSPYQWERYTGKTLEPGQSHIKDEMEFLKANADKLIGISAIGGPIRSDSYPGAVIIPEGFVAVTATKGGVRSAHAEARTFLVPQAEYSKRNETIRFIVDPERHPLISCVRV